jgi:hypothetical protein
MPSHLHEDGESLWSRFHTRHVLVVGFRGRTCHRVANSAIIEAHVSRTFTTDEFMYGIAHSLSCNVS